jgi:hypothetical protein
MTAWAEHAKAAITASPTSRFHTTSVDDGNAQTGSRTLVRSEHLVEQSWDMAAVRQTRELIGSCCLERRHMGLAQGLLVLLQCYDVGPDGQHPAVREHRVIDPEPAAIDQIGLNRLAGHAPAPRQGSGDEGLNVIVIEPHPKPVPKGVAEDGSEGERPVIVAQEHAMIGLVGVPEIVLGIADGNRLPAFREGLHKATEGFVIRLERE